jgi:hypothetical protein
VHLLERDESGGVGGANTGASVSDRSVGDGELAKVVAYHLGFDVNMIEHLAIVHSHLRVDHLGDNEHVAKVSLDHSGLVKDTTLCGEKRKHGIENEMKSKACE